MSDAADPRLEIVPNRHRVRVIHRGITYADSHGALTVRETGLPDIHYLPRSDVNMHRLVKSSVTSVCPLRGRAVYFNLQTEDGVIENAAWSYEEPGETAFALAHYVAFDVARVDSLIETS
ncbi:hypothetical protein WT41_08210 [Burkholderia territorii]|uniref:DUF427 domain-containing protein n=1 Tax=Burkholderia territorii TaxID=1503055 RepID=UPI000751B96B|nr:DUF427 domain-containing protein [Burkholderia territorii]KWA15554.1 hypothetical protein WT38_27410 [Burkholderia territorii]KWA34718.1 hypothetical protein WT39_04580 [Burkholderia territorii]KWA47937.1 hypothetical protein WT41_08210 [Burkholderia territorii]